MKEVQVLKRELLELDAELKRFKQELLTTRLETYQSISCGSRSIGLRYSVSVSASSVQRDYSHKVDHRDYEPHYKQNPLH